VKPMPATFPSLNILSSCFVFKILGINYKIMKSSKLLFSSEFVIFRAILEFFHSGGNPKNQLISIENLLFLPII
jgi:hypothetical protein